MKLKRIAEKTVENHGFGYGVLGGLALGLIPTAIAGGAIHVVGDAENDNRTRATGTSVLVGGIVGSAIRFGVVLLFGYLALRGIQDLPPQTTGG